MIDFEKLGASFPAEDIEWRVGSTTKDKAKGMALAYLTARTVMDRLDAVCGPAGWCRRYTHVGPTTVCEIGIEVEPGRWVYKADGAGHSDIEAEKGSLSDAFKRAAVNWKIGRYLYDLDSPWVELDEYKRIKKSEYAKLNALLRRDAGPLDEALRQNTTQGLAPKAPTKNDTKPQAKAWTDAAVESLKFAAHPREIDEWFNLNSRALEKLEALHDDQYQRIVSAAAETRETLSARAA